MKNFKSDRPKGRFNKVRHSKEFDYEKAKRPFGREKLQQFDAVCAKCGKDCQVPFKPRDPKSVYCRDCFKKNDERPRSFERRPFEPRQERPEFRPERYDAAPSENEIQQINRKLDKIMKALKIQ